MALVALPICPGRGERTIHQLLARRTEIAAQGLSQIWALDGLGGAAAGLRPLTESRPGNEYYPDWAPKPKRKKHR